MHKPESIKRIAGIVNLTLAQRGVAATKDDPARFCLFYAVTKKKEPTDPLIVCLPF